jgi:hypothetical protein
VRIRPGVGAGESLPLATVRRGFTIAVGEASRVSLVARYGERAPRRVAKTFSARGTLRLHVPKGWLERIEGLVAAKQRPRLILWADALDAEGNMVTVGGEFRVRP